MQALEGIRVLDLSRLLPGPYCTMLLADFGAEVIKIEEPGRGDYARSFPPFLKDFGYWHLQLNRNKKSVVLNLKSDAGRRAFLELVKTADVVVESYRPGVLEKLGIAASTVTANRYIRKTALSMAMWLDVLRRPQQAHPIENDGQASPHVGQNRQPQTCMSSKSQGHEHRLCPKRKHDIGRQDACNALR